MNEGNFTKGKKAFAIITGLAIAAISAYNSKNGFVSNSSDSLLALMGWSFSAACMAAQFMFTSEFKKLNWTVIFLGAFAYMYSIPTNYFGLQSWNGVATEHNFVNAIAAIFMDVYPEAAIAWALGESRLGDMFGNMVRTIQRKDELTDTGPRPAQPRQPYQQPRPAQPNYTPTYPPVTQRPTPRPTPAGGAHPTQHTLNIPDDIMPDWMKE